MCRVGFMEWYTGNTLHTTSCMTSTPGARLQICIRLHWSCLFDLRLQWKWNNGKVRANPSKGVALGSAQCSTVLNQSHSAVILRWIFSLCKGNNETCLCHRTDTHLFGSSRCLQLLIALLLWFFKGGSRPSTAASPRKRSWLVTAALWRSIKPSHGYVCIHAASVYSGWTSWTSWTTSHSEPNRSSSSFSGPGCRYVCVYVLSPGSSEQHTSHVFSVRHRCLARCLTFSKLSCETEKSTW